MRLVSTSNDEWLLFTIWTSDAEVFIASTSVTANNITTTARLPVDVPIQMLIGPESAIDVASAVNGSFVSYAIQPLRGLAMHVMRTLKAV